jgi:hypothetical protein
MQRVTKNPASPQCLIKYLSGLSTVSNPSYIDKQDVN